jgi:hypothetical protein
MTFLPQIQDRLRHEFSELCAACLAEQAWLEDGDGFGPDEAKHGQANRREAAPTAGPITGGP